MESFSALQESVVDQIKSLERECNAVFIALRAENTYLRQALSDISRQELLALTPRFQEAFEDVSPKDLPYTPRQACSASDALCVRPGSLTREVSNSSDPLCVKGWSNGFHKNHPNLQIARQPLEDLPLEPYGVSFEREQSPDSPKGGQLSSSILGVGNIIDIMALGGKDIIDNSPINRWALLFAGITIPARSRDWLKKKAQENKLGIRQIWTQCRKKKSFSSIGRPGQSGKVSLLKCSDHSVYVGSVLRSRTPLQRFTIHPDSKLSWAHALLQGCLILFDVIDFPLSAFQLGDTQFTDLMLVIATVFWTWDVCLSFLQGFHTKNGVIEMRPSMVALHYAKRWLAFDIVVVALDWVSLIVFTMEKDPSTESRVARVSKFRRISRIVRGGRVVRMAKAFERMHALVDATASTEWIVMAVRILLLLVTILLINHYVACAWYFIASSNSDEVTWLKVQMIEHAPTIDKYLYSLHWALTQFTPCTNNIAPANARERCFAAVVVLFALVIFSAFLSSLTTAIMQIKKLNFERYSEEVLIREFMMSKRVPLAVANQVWHFFRKNYRLRSKIVQESDVPFFAVLPKRLRRELRTYVYIPTLSRFHVLRELIEHPLSPLGSQLTEVVSTLVPLNGHDLFLEGDFSTHMYHFVTGIGNYLHNGDIETIEAPVYVSEAVLWLTEWQHQGRLTVTGNRCELLLLDVARFLDVLDCEADDMTMRSLRKYASLYAQHLEDLESDAKVSEDFWDARVGHAIFSDLPFTQDIRERMCIAAFGFKAPTDNSISGGRSIGSHLNDFWRKLGRMVETIRKQGTMWSSSSKTSSS